jgi:GNAT superfamily N-acetyltransferase
MRLSITESGFRRLSQGSSKYEWRWSEGADYGSLVAVDAEIGDLIGYLSYLDHDGEYVIDMMGVEEEYRRQGVATALIDEFLRRVGIPYEDLNWGTTNSESAALKRSLDEQYGKVAGIFKEYYRYEPGMTIEQMQDRWINNNELIEPHDMPFMLPVDELWPYREYEWTREEARLEPEEWDELKESMSQGWQEGSWLTLNIFKDGEIYLGEGNHRLTIADELGMKEVPVSIWFRS